jgi:3-oxoacyl-[acyl-carrier protein] reductase
MFDLTGKRALVTGASGGIGGAIAKALHRQGAKVALSGTRTETLEALKAELGSRAYVTPADLGSVEGAKALFADATEAIGGVDILINNAGLTRDNLSMRMQDEEWEQVLDINLSAAFRLSKECLRGMMKNRWGRIVSITSIVGVTGNPGQANYAASKSGLIGMSKSMAQEVASRSITINCLAPGFIETPMTGSLGDKQKEKLMTGIPCGRLGCVDDIAPGVVYLVSDEAAYVTGQTLHINGGMAMI